jgi:predicted RecB family nuclease
MILFSKKKTKKTDLLQMSDCERIKLLREVKQNLQQKAVESKLWKTFMETENLSVNGEEVCSNDITLQGLSLNDLLKGV